jgi:hypothetical protein
MERVTRPGGKIVILDMVSSEDPKESAWHNRIERLCDPSHARALTESEFAELFASPRLRVASKTKGESTQRLEDWIQHGSPPEKQARRIRTLMQRCLEVDRSGLHVREEGGEIVFTHTGATYVVEKLA